MPFVNLYITGKKEDISKIIKKEFKLKNTIPPPEDLAPISYIPDKSENFEAIKWYKKNWGIKWDINDSNVEKTNKQTKISFHTAEDIPIAWLKNVSFILPNVKFKMLWADEQYPRGGEVKAESGEINGKEYIAGSIADEFMKENFNDNWLSFHENQDSDVESYNCESDSEQEENSEGDELEEDIVEIINNEYIERKINEFIKVEKSMKFFEIITKNKLDELDETDLDFFIKSLIIASKQRIKN